MFAAARKGDPLTHDLLVPSGIIAPPIIGPCPAGMVIIEGLPAAHVTCSAVCVGTIIVGVVHPPPPGPPPPVLSGSLGVMIHNKPAARWAPSGDIAACGSFLGDMKLLPMRRVFIGGISIGAAAPSTPTPPSAFDEFSNWVGNLFRPADAQVELYGNGIAIQGTPEFRAQTRASLDMLNRLPTGQQLLNRIGNSDQAVTITEETAPNGYCTPHNGTNAQNGTGTGSDVAWNPNHHTTDAADATTGTPGSTVVLAHELVHAMHNAEGNHHNGPYDSYPGQSGSSQRGEERATVGAGGTSVNQPNGTPAAVPDHSGDSPTENSIRDDLGIPRRPTYYPSTWGGGAPW
jgi:hypothetical protein